MKKSRRTMRYNLLTMLAVIVLMPLSLGAVEFYNTSDDPVTIPLSVDEETIIEFPENIQFVQERNGESVFYDYLAPMGKFFFIHVPKNRKKALMLDPSPVELTFVTDARVQTIRLIPTHKSGERIKFIDASSTKAEADSEISGLGYLALPMKHLAQELMVGLASGVPPKGFRIQAASSDLQEVKFQKDTSSPVYYEPTQYTSDYRLDLKKVLYNKKIVAREYILSNITPSALVGSRRLTETMLYSPGVVSVSIERHQLLARTPQTERTGQYKTSVWIVSSRSGHPLDESRLRFGHRKSFVKGGTR